MAIIFLFILVMLIGVAIVAYRYIIHADWFQVFLGDLAEPNDSLNEIAAARKKAQRELVASEAAIKNTSGRVGKLQRAVNQQPLRGN